MWIVTALFKMMRKIAIEISVWRCRTPSSAEPVGNVTHHTSRTMLLLSPPCTAPWMHDVTTTDGLEGIRWDKWYVVYF